MTCECSSQDIEGDTSSHISIQQSWIHVCAGTSSGSTTPLVASARTDAAAASATGNSAKTSGDGETGMDGVTGGVPLPRQGLLVEVAGEAALLSTKVYSSKLVLPCFRQL